MFDGGYEMIGKLCWGNGFSIGYIFGMSVALFIWFLGEYLHNRQLKQSEK